ncbi:hypothetical protein K0M31_002385, partial [Melipona bicolor]
MNRRNCEEQRTPAANPSNVVPPRWVGNNARHPGQGTFTRNAALLVSETESNFALMHSPWDQLEDERGGVGFP